MKAGKIKNLSVGNSNNLLQDVHDILRQEFGDKCPVCEKWGLKPKAEWDAVNHHYESGLTCKECGYVVRD